MVTSLLSWDDLNTECMQAEALTEMGKLLHKQRDYRRARARLQEAVDLRPDSLQVWALLAMLHSLRHSETVLPGCPDTPKLGSLDIRMCNTAVIPVIVCHLEMNDGRACATSTVNAQVGMVFVMGHANAGSMHCTCRRGHFWACASSAWGTSS